MSMLTDLLAQSVALFGLSLFVFVCLFFRIGLSAFLLHWAWSRLRKQKMTFKGFFSFLIFCLGLTLLFWSK